MLVNLPCYKCASTPFSVNLAKHKKKLVHQSKRQSSRFMTGPNFVINPLTSSGQKPSQRFSRIPAVLFSGMRRGYARLKGQRLSLPSEARGKHGKPSNIDVPMFYSRPFVIDSFLQKSHSIFSRRACVSISIFWPANFNCSLPTRRAGANCDAPGQ